MGLRLVFSTLHAPERALFYDTAELELELIQSHMAQKPVLRGEVGCACVARVLRVCCA